MQPDIQIRVTELVTEIYEQYRPELGRVYDAVQGITKNRKKSKEFVIVDILDKRIVLRKGEYEIVTV